MTNNNMILVLLAILLFSGCTTIAPQYQPDFELVNELKDMNVPSMKSGEFTEADDSLNSISIRGGAMVSPYGKSYAEYLKKALEEELKQSDLWDPSSKIVISGTLLKNDLDGSGTNIGVSDISAIFVVTKDDSEIYNKTHTIHHQWESSFMGAIAVPKARQNYAISIQKLLRNFFLDKELLIALKR
jgi:hypothetical protein